MNSRHLPAGQAMQGAGGPGSEMGPGNPGPRGGHRQRYNTGAYVPQHQHPAAHNMYPPYGMPHAGHPYHHNQYYNQHMNPYVQQQQYMHYQHQQQHNFHQAQYARSPPVHAIQQQPPSQPQQPHQPQQHPSHYAPIVTSGMGQPPYSRQPQQSPAVPVAYQPPPPPAAVPVSHPPQTPSSTTSAQAVAPPPPVASMPPSHTPTHSVVTSHAPDTPKPESSLSHPTSIDPSAEAAPISTVQPGEDLVEGEKEPFPAPLPWFSHPNEPFPKRAKRKRRRPAVIEEQSMPPVSRLDEIRSGAVEEPKTEIGIEPKHEELTATETVVSEPASVELVITQEQVQEENKAAPEETSAENLASPPTTIPAKAPSAANPPSKPIAPIPRIPAIPAVPRVPKKQPAPEKAQTQKEQPQQVSTPAGATVPKSTDLKSVASGDPDDKSMQGQPGEQPTIPAATPAPVAPSKPKTWSGLFAKPASKTSTSNGASAAAVAARTQAVDAAGRAIAGAPFSKGSLSITETLRSYRVGAMEELHFLEPRGLINTGNMCYMNSVLQVLIFCVPFYDFLTQIFNKAAHSFKNDTPLLDSLLLFREEFKVLASADSVEALRRRLKPENLEKFGDPFTPEFVYDIIKKLPRFASMRRGHQQDAEEFLGFLLESLHEECMHAMKPNTNESATSSPAASSPVSTHEAADANGWMEVGYRQKPTVTRSSGHQVQTPITKIFGGQLRSELRVPGLKDSVTLEPYQPLQLDITANSVRNIVDALRGLTNAENLQGDFKSPRGRSVGATKQVSIDSLPPVLILHLKRFQFDAEGNGTVKVWKKVGYPLELEIPKEVIHRSKRNMVTPKYKLTAVVYHHGKNASGGHYTVDVRRQDGVEWIRIDDTVIRRIRSEDVAEGGAEEVIKATPRSENKDGIVGGTGNRFNGIGDDESGDEEGWKHVPSAANGKKWSSVVNGGSVPPPAKKSAVDMKDNKVAYILFYQRI